MNVEQSNIESTHVSRPLKRGGGGLYKGNLSYTLPTLFLKSKILHDKLKNLKGFIVASFTITFLSHLYLILFELDNTVPVFNVRRKPTKI